MGQLRHLRILLWKNFLIRSRQPILLSSELIWPFFLFLILAALRSRTPASLVTECHFNGRAMPSAGIVPFIQSILCTTSNACSGQTLTGEMPGSVPQYGTGNTGVNAAINNFYAAYSQFTPSSQTQIVTLIDNLAQLQTLYPSSSSSIPSVVSLLIDTTQLQTDLTASGLSVSSSSAQQLIGVILYPPSGASQLSAAAFKGFEGWAANTDMNTTLTIICASGFAQSTTNNTASMSTAAQTELCNLDVTQMATLLELIGSNIKTKSASIDGQTLSLYNNVSTLMVQLSPLLNNVTSLLQSVAAVLPQVPANANASVWIASIGRFLCSQFTFTGASSSSSLTSAQTALLNLPAGFGSSSNTGNITNGPSADQLTSYCSALVNGLQSSPATASVWQQYQPFIRGKIPYAPDTPVTRKIIEYANRTFSVSANVVTVASQWLAISSTLRNFLQNTSVQYAMNEAYAICVAQMVNSNVTSSTVCPSLTYFTSSSSFSTANMVSSLISLETSASQLINLTGCFDFQKFVPLADEGTLETYAAGLAQQNRLWGAIVFDLNQMQLPVNYSGSAKPTFMYYKIRMDPGKVDPTATWFDKVYKAGPRASPSTDMYYFQYGFAYLQDIMERAFIEYQVNSTVDDGVYMQQFPYPCYISDAFATFLSGMLPMFIVLAWILTAAATVKNIVYEREAQLKVLMRVMGLRNLTHWTASFITCFVVAMASAIILIVIMKLGKVLAKTDASLLLVVFLSYVIVTILFSMLVSQAFDRANVAAVSGGVAFFVTYLPYIFIVTWITYLPPAALSGLSLLSNVAISITFRYIGLLEGAGTGAQWSNIGQPVELGSSYTLLGAMSMLWIDSIIYLALLTYIDLVKSVENDGCGKPWHYPLTFWCGSRVSPEETTQIEANSSKPSQSNTLFESEPEPTLPISVQVEKLCKVYNRTKGHPPALSDVSLTFYDGQISGLLGHNGAGKSTFLSILTGFAAPTSGRVSIYGLDLNFESEAVRRRLGFCPQHNVLFDQLTVEEHILFYGRLKEVPESLLQAEVDRLVHATRLTKKRHALSHTLSGGMKRKLSIAVAFIGDNDTNTGKSSTNPTPEAVKPAHKLIVLDEPTAGVDPHARRAIWDLLIHFKRDNTIVFTTHHMDEADILSDRIYIVSRGMLCTVGSTAFLKQTFGSGYYLSLVKSPSAVADQKQSDAAPASSGKLNEDADPIAKRVATFVRRYVARAALVDNSPTELTFLLPNSAGSGGSGSGAAKPAQAAFIEFFRALDAALPQLGISTYGLSDTTLEEVFLKLASDAPKAIDAADASKGRSAKTVSSLTDDALQSGVDGQTDDGRLPRPASRLSFRRNASLTSSIIHEHKNKAKNGDANADADSASQSGRASDADLHTSSRAELVTNEASGGKVNVSVSMTPKGEMPTLVMPDLKRATGCALSMMQFKALFIKRWLHLKRSQLAWVSEILLPVIFMLLAMIASQILPSPSYTQSPLELQPWLLTPTRGPNSGYLQFVYSNDNYSYPLANRLELALVNNQTNHGTRCMNSSIHTTSGYPCIPSLVPTVSQNLTSIYTAQQYESIYGAILSTPSVLISLRNNMTLNSTADSLQLPLAMCSATSRSFAAPAASAQWTVWLNTLLGTADYLQQLTGHNLSLYLVQTNGMYEQLLYGAFSFGELNPYAFISNPQVNVSAIAFNSTNLAYVPIIGSATMNSSALVYYSVPSTNSILAAPSLISPASNLSSYLQSAGYQLSIGLNQLFAATYTGNNQKVWFNNKGYISSVAYMNALNNLRLRAYVQSAIDLAYLQLGSSASATSVMQSAGLSSLTTSNFGITVFSHPLKRTPQQYAVIALSSSQGSLSVAISLVFALAFLPSSFLMYLITDRESRSKLLQCLTGLPRSLYWSANFAWDYLNYVVSAILIIAIFGIFSQSVAAFASGDNFSVLVVILFAYGFAAIPMLYPLSFYATVPSTAFIFCSCASLFIGTITTLTSVILESLDDSTLISIGQSLQKIFPIFPQYCLGRSAIIIGRVSLTNDLLTNAYGPSYPLTSAWAWNNAGQFVVYLVVEGIAFSALTLIVEFSAEIGAYLRRVFCGCKKSESGVAFDEIGASGEEDADVAREKARVLNEEPRTRSGNVQVTGSSSSTESSDILRLINLRKVYQVSPTDRSCACASKNFVAVKGLTLGLKRGECFGLLGVNGAGKTTTFKMLTGDVPVTSGDARIGGWSILKDMNRVKAAIGYCPQFDALSGHLTAVEHLDFFSRLRGVAANDRAQMCAALIARLGLSNHAHRMVRTYSGGTKRKLSTAIALLGQPSVLYLDEPTSGMDPQARRFLWNVLESVIDELKCTVVLTTHSMDECEALCSRLAIMVNGSFRCLGSVTHLKNRFGGGYMIEIRMNHQAVIALLPAARRRLLTTVADDLRRVLPVTLKDSQNTILEFHLTSVRCGVADEDKGDSANAPTLAEVFEQLEAIRTRHNAFICDYSVCQTSLDHVFIHFAKMQAELHEEEEFDEDMAQASGSVDPSQQPVAFSELSNQPSAPPPTSEQAATAVENENEAYTPLPIPNAESNSYPNPTYTHDDLV